MATPPPASLIDKSEQNGKKVECVCTYNKDMGKLIISEKQIQFRSLHYDETILFTSIVNIKKKGQKTISVRTNDQTYAFGPFDDMRRGVVFEALKTSFENTAKNDNQNAQGGGGININDIKGIDDQIVKDLFSENLSNDLPPGAFADFDDKDSPCIDEVFPIKLKPLFALLMSDSSGFMEELHTQEGDVELVINPWRLDDSKAFYTRLFDFRKRSRLVNALVHQTQIARLKSPTELMVETSNKMEGVPFADCFTVDTKWRITEEGNQCRIKVGVRVVFTKSVSLVKGKIERNSIQGTQDYFKALAVLLRSKFTGEGDTGAPGAVRGVPVARQTEEKIGLSSIIAITLGIGCVLFFILWLWYWWSAGSWSVYVSELESKNLQLELKIEELRKQAVFTEDSKEFLLKVKNWKAELLQGVKVLESLAERMLPSELEGAAL